MTSTRSLARWITGTFIPLALALSVAGSSPSRAQDAGYPCDGVLAAPELLTAALGQVPKYGSTYVLAYPEALAEQVDSINSAALSTLRVGVYEGSPALEMAAQAQLETQVYRLDAPAKIVEDLLAGTLDVGILWAPLAGLGALELDFNYGLSFRTIGEPSAAPPALRLAEAGTEARAEAVAPAACVDEVRGLLEGYGVVPAEKFVALDIRDFLQLRPPPRSLAEAREGAGLYATHCAKCHGPEAVAAQGELAPVDLLVSVPRFSFPGFLYIALNGRTQKGMPRFLGTLTQEQLRLIYQYARERSHGAIKATQAVQTAAPSQPASGPQ